MGGFEEEVAQLAELGLLTKRQAEAYLLRDVHTVGREEAALHLGISPNVLDKHLRAARDKLEAARESLERLEEIEQAHYPPVPDECTECATTLAGPFTTDEEGNALCLDCGGIDPETISELSEW